ncbi:MAG: hypothetical protein IJW92_02905 [Clostridia bacterium]|nr:hypothetical protein [Clostridia bacterium]
MNDFSISMALVDYIPVICFAIAAFILLGDLYNKMCKGAFALFSAGVIDVAIAGALKATWKLLYATGTCDFEALDVMFFPVQSIGFLLAGIGALLMLVNKRGKTSLLAVAPPVLSGTFVFVGLMVAGLGIMDAVLCILSAKLKKPALIAVFVLSFACSLCMGYLSSQDFAEASMNWIAEGVNVVGQGTLLIGVVMLHKNGLSTLRLDRGEQA